MSKRVAVLAVNPVNGSGLFQYLEAFFENGISYKVFAVAETTEIKTNSGIKLTVDDVVANLKGHEDEFDALVFGCGDAVPVFSENAGKQYNQDNDRDNFINHDGRSDQRHQRNDIDIICRTERP